MTYYEECDWIDHKSYFIKNRFILRDYEYCDFQVFQAFFFQVLKEIIQYKFINII